MGVKLDAIRAGRVFEFNGGARRVLKVHAESGTESGLVVAWEYADGRRRFGRIGGEQSAHHFRRAARAEIPDAWRQPLITLYGTDRAVSVFPEARDVTIRTHCPAKWAFVDRESAEVWGHDGRDFHRMSPDELRALADLLERKAVAAKEDQLQLALP